MRHFVYVLLVGGLFGCASFGLLDYGTHANEFYYLGHFDENVYYREGRNTYQLLTYSVAPNVITPSSMRRWGRNPNHYWPLATSELHNDVRHLFTIQVMHVYAASYDFTPPLDWTFSPPYKPFANYGSGLTIADELKDLDGIDTDIGYYGLKLDDRTLLLLLKALELKFADQPALIDYHANACFAGFAPADQKRSGLNLPASRYTCERLFQSLKSYLPMVTGEADRPSLDHLAYGPVYARFKFVKSLGPHSQIKAFFEDERVDHADKVVMAKRFLHQLRPEAAIPFASFKQTGFRPVLRGLDHYTYAVSSNPKYLYASDPFRIQHFLYFDPAMSHDFLQFALLGLKKLSPVRSSGEYSLWYEAMKGPNAHSSVTPITADNRLARNVYPAPLVRCLHNRRHQSVSLPQVSRMTYYCSSVNETARKAIPDPYRKPSLNIVDDSEHITGLTVLLNTRLAKPTADDNYSTTFYTIHLSAPFGVRDKLIKRQIPNAFVGRIIRVDGVVYGYVHHQGIAYYILLDDLKAYLTALIED